MESIVAKLIVEKYEQKLDNLNNKRLFDTTINHTIESILTGYRSIADFAHRSTLDNPDILLYNRNRSATGGSNEEFVAKWVVLNTATRSVTKSRGRQAMDLHNITDNLGLYQALCEAVERLSVVQFLILARQTVRRSGPNKSTSQPIWSNRSRVRGHCGVFDDMLRSL